MFDGDQHFKQYSLSGKQGIKHKPCSLPFLLGVVKGSLDQIDHALSRTTSYPTTAIQGQMGFYTEPTLQVEFFLFVFQEQVVLQLTSVQPLEKVLAGCKSFEVLPNVVFLARKSEDQKITCELVWFTPYTSTHSRVVQCMHWMEKGKEVRLLDPTLYAYLPHLQFVTVNEGDGYDAIR